MLHYLMIVENFLLTLRACLNFGENYFVCQSELVEDPIFDVLKVIDKLSATEIEHKYYN